MNRSATLSTEAIFDPYYTRDEMRLAITKAMKTETEKHIDRLTHLTPAERARCYAIVETLKSA